MEPLAEAVIGGIVGSLVGAVAGSLLGYVASNHLADKQRAKDVAARQNQLMPILDRELSTIPDTVSHSADPMNRRFFNRMQLVALDPLLSLAGNLDEDLVGMLMGLKVSLDDYNDFALFASSIQSASPTEREALQKVAKNLLAKINEYRDVVQPGLRVKG